MQKYIKILILIGIILTLGIYSVFVEPNKLEITNYTIQDESLQGIKIVFASDFHIKPNQQKRLEKIVELINLQNPDLVLSAGDFVCGHLKHTTMPPEDIAKGLGKVKSKYGFYTTLGNHDLWHDTEEFTKNLEANNIKVLNNANKKIIVNGKTIYIAGIQYQPSMIQISNAIDNTQKPTIMLTHSPDEFKKIPQDYVNLILAGHTHGGQIRIPFIGPLFTASSYGDKYAKGFIEEDGKKMITTTGIGTSILPIRFNCPPEIVIIEFK
ncbi:MAG: metallophosphoesterase [Cyanobacteria bacterium SIG32]|nr:metallophosphoesterase [Cyanobacteria bacterium SIG32]